MNCDWNEVLKQQKESEAMALIAKQALHKGVALYSAGFLGKWAVQYLRQMGAEYARDFKVGGQYVDN